ncbi:MAG: DUF6483 family protein [Verrucomicrobiota bacterium]
MIRRDYLLRIIEQCIQALTRSGELVRRREWPEARCEVDRVARDLTGHSLTELTDRSDSELTALLLTGEPTQVLHQKALLLAAVLRRAAEIEAGEGRPERALIFSTKGLRVALDVCLREGIFEMPEFVPKVEHFVTMIGVENLTLDLRAALLQFYERSGQYAKGEDALFWILELEPRNPAVIQFGIQFYERLSRQSDEALILGDLPRDEVETGLRELRERLEAIGKRG